MFLKLCQQLTWRDNEFDKLCCGVHLDVHVLAQTWMVEQIRIRAEQATYL